jgi:hypothetical protein
MPFPTTRGALEQTLAGLGYQPTYGKNEFGFPFVVFTHKESGAAVTLRVLSADEPVQPSDLLASEHSIEWWGVTDRETFYQLLKNETSAKLQAA